MSNIDYPDRIDGADLLRIKLYSLPTIVMNTPAMENLFSYGTLQLESVQQTTFGRLLNGTPDAIVGYSRSWIEITDAHVLATSGQTHHPIVKFTGNAKDHVEGTVFQITHEELLRADEYEVSDYKRVEVSLRSGGTTWVYVAR
jgi:gamma-glutamylcyclotransferase (GGCT)/AIG2-like uncharacterized protein YtfP